MYTGRDLDCGHRSSSVAATRGASGEDQRKRERQWRCSPHRGARTGCRCLRVRSWRAGGLTRGLTRGCLPTAQTETPLASSTPAAHHANAVGRTAVRACAYDTCTPRARGDDRELLTCDHGAGGKGNFFRVGNVIPGLTKNARCRGRVAAQRDRASETLET